jgi:poly(3-hydroxybutyrate) depolymerase
MREFRVLAFAGFMAFALVIFACAEASSPTGSGGATGSLGTGGSGGLAGGAGRATGGTTGAGGAIGDASVDRSITASVDAVEYASLDGPTGCGLGGAPTGVLMDQTITVAGRARTYVLSVPKSYDPSTPLALVFGWHGHGATGNLARQRFAIEPAAAGGAIFVYPDGLGTAGNTDWHYSATGADVELFDTLVNYLTSNYCVDRNRIFSTGLSAGAFFTNALGCFRGNVLRAIAPVAGGPPSSSDGSPVACAGNVGAWIAHASNDDTVDINTYGLATRDFWIARNGCSTPLASVVISPAECKEYQGCQPDLPVVFCMHTDGHNWPRMADCGDGGMCFDAGSAIWSFFARFK